MENNIVIWLGGKYVNYNYNDFINVFFENNFFYNNRIVIEKFLFEVFKIKEQDKEKILNSFNLKISEIENYLKDKNNHDKKDYMDILYNYLMNAKFYLINNQKKKEFLEMLGIPHYAYNCVLEDFSDKQKFKK